MKFRLARIVLGAAAFGAAWCAWSYLVFEPGGPSTVVPFLVIAFLGGAVIGSRWAALLVPAVGLLPPTLESWFAPPEGTNYSELTAAGTILVALVMLAFVGLVAWAGFVTGRLVSALLDRWRTRPAAAAPSLADAGHEAALLLGGVAASAVVAVGAFYVVSNPPRWLDAATPDRWPKQFYTGEPWDGRGQGASMSQAEIEAFDDFPLFWLGPSYDGYHLQEAIDLSARVVFVYGTCPRFPANISCSSPLVVHVLQCSYNPYSPLHRASGPPEELPDGVVVQPQFEGSAAVWTGGVQLQVIFGADPGRVREVVADFEPVGRSAAVGPADFAACE